MSDLPEVEYISDDGDPGIGDEALPPRRPGRSRWPWIAVLALVAVAVGLIVADRGGSHERATPTTSVTQLAPIPQPDPSASIGTHTNGRTITPLPVAGRRLPLPTKAPALAVATTQTSTWVLQPRRISMVDDFQTVSASTRWPGAPADATVLLQVDTIAGEAWVIVSGTSHDRIYEFSAFALRPISVRSLPDIGGAASLDGHLYVSSAGRLMDIPPLAPLSAPRIVGWTRDELGPVVADLARSLVLVVDSSFATHLWSYRIGHRLEPSPLTMPISKTSIAVTSHGDWLGGFAHGPLLWHLTKAADRVSPASALDRVLSPGAVVVAAGRDVFWVRAGSSGDELWCVNAATGRIAQHWDLAGPVASTSGVALVGTSTGVVPLNLTSCRG